MRRNGRDAPTTVVRPTTASRQWAIMFKPRAADLTPNPENKGKIPALVCANVDMLRSVILTPGAPSIHGMLDMMEPGDGHGTALRSARSGALIVSC